MFIILHYKGNWLSIVNVGMLYQGSRNLVARSHKALWQQVN
jgi:hypothetical protein